MENELKEASKRKKEESIHKGHRDRIRKRYYENGLDGFAEHEVLEFLLFYCYPQGDTNEKAHQMLNEFGSLHNLFESDVPTLKERLKCSENIAVLLNLIPALANRYYRSKWGRNLILDNGKVACEYVLDLFVGHTVERFYLLSLDAQKRLNHVSLISEGTLNESSVYLREVMREAIQNQAACVILTHNHPGGTLKPSRSDLEATRVIAELLRAIQVRVLDHIIVAGDTYYSFAARRQHVTGYEAL